MDELQTEAFSFVLIFIKSENQNYYGTIPAWQK